jgi:lycopene beta-cyclase
MLFAAALPRERYRVFERFYRLPEPLIERFYAGKSTWADRARVLIGRPPVPVLRALRALVSRSPRLLAPHRKDNT